MRPGHRPRSLGAALALASFACAPQSDPRCGAPERIALLPDSVRESSGLALSAARPGVLWTHNDSGNEPVIFAIDTAGALLETVHVQDATFTDWEDIASGACPDGGDCIYIADTGNNRQNRDTASIFFIREPAAGERRSAPARRLGVRYPDGQWDTEALFVRPGPELFLISKGVSRPVTVFRYPPPFRAGQTVTLERVGQLTPEAVDLPDQVTAAAVSPDGDWIAVRTYTALQFYRFADGRLTPLLDSAGVDLAPLAEPQGEGLAAGDGVLYLSSERGLDDRAPLSRIRCGV